MNEVQTLILGFIAGVTILLGLPVARVRGLRPSTRQFLSALATGVLLFLIWDVLTNAYVPLSDALDKLHHGSGGFGSVLGYASLFLGGIAVGLMSLVYYEKWLAKRGKPRPFGPGAMTRGELTATHAGMAGWSAPRRLAFLIAVGIGLHNLGEGLAIGSSAATGAIGLATILVIGFSLHNATEGFGIVAPLAADGDRPSWRFLLLMGLIGGGPTFVGTVVGRQFTSPAVGVIFLTLAAGSILYVVVQLIKVGAKSEKREWMYWGIMVGLFAGFITDMIVTAGGA